VPVAITALVLVVIAKPITTRRPAPMDYRGLALVTVGVGLIVLGLQQSAQWSWSNPTTSLCIAVGVVLLAIFVRVERRTDSPLINIAIFRDHVFLLDNVVLAIAMMVFVPVFFFASEYSQISLGDSPQRPASPCSTSSPDSSSPLNLADACSTGAAPGALLYSAAHSPAWPWRSGQFA